MNILVTGGSGQLGRDLVPLLKKQKDFIVFSPNRDEMDLANEDSIKSYLNRHTFDVIIHAGAYTKVDQAEDEQELCYTINVDSTRYLIEYANKVGAYIIYISTDYVFDGLKSSPYDPYDLRHPLSVYGKSKSLAEEIVIDKASIKNEEENHLIIRTSWVYGNKGPNFVLTMIRLMREKEEISVVDDQLGSPTYTVDLAQGILEAMQKKVTGIIHLTGSDVTTWYRFANMIKEKIHASCKIKPIASKAYKSKAKRPKYSNLSKEHLSIYNLTPLPSWADGVKRYIDSLKETRL